MKCRTIHKKLIFFLEGDLRKEEMDEIKIHLQDCSTCAAFVEEMNKTLGIFQAEKNPEINPFFYTRLKAKLENLAPAQYIPILKPAYLRILQPITITVVMLLGIFSGIKIGNAPHKREVKTEIAELGLVPFLDEMTAEPIETFIFSQDGNE